MGQTEPTQSAGTPRRRQTFWVVAGAVLVGLAVLIALRPKNEDEATPVATTSATTTTSTPTEGGQPPLPEGTSVPGLPGDEVNTLPPLALRAPAEAFAQSWMDYQYGLGSLDTVKGATRDCLAQVKALGQNPAHQGKPRVVALRATRKGSGLVIYARIDDGSRYGTYTVAFDFGREHGQWLCTSLIEES